MILLSHVLHTEEDSVAKHTFCKKNKKLYCHLIVQSNTNDDIIIIIIETLSQIALCALISRV